MIFLLLTCLIVLHSTTYLIWQFRIYLLHQLIKPSTKNNNREISFEEWFYCLILSFRDILLIETLFWLIILFLSGLILLSQFVYLIQNKKVCFFQLKWRTRDIEPGI